MRFGFKIFPRPRLTIRQDLPESAVIKQTAHALTVLAVAWIGVSLLAIVAYKAGKEDSDSSWVSAAIWAWRAHALIAVSAIVFWIFEKPSLARYVKEESEEDEKDEA